MFNRLVVLARKRLARFASLGLAVGWTLNVALADEFVLRDGRSIRGVVKSTTVNSETKTKQYAVELDSGVIVLVRAPEVKTHKASIPQEAEYAAHMKEPKDSVEFHLAVAAWCKEKGLPHHEVAHYERVIELEPDNALGRAALKYTRSKDGRWVKIDQQQLEERGKVSVGGKFRFPEVVALEQAQEQAKQDRIRLTAEIVGWQRDVLDNNRRATDSQAKLRGLDGPYASAALSDVLYPKVGPVRKQPPPEALRQLYVEVLTRLADPVAVQTLIRMSLSDPSSSVRDLCFDALRKIAPRPATMAYIQTLRSEKVDEINAAGRGLAAMGDKVAITYLIERLVSFHKETVSAGTPSVNFGQDGQYTMGNAKAEVRMRPNQNPDVLNALIAITGQNHQYDRSAWLAWYNQTHYGSARDLRRDP